MLFLSLVTIYITKIVYTHMGRFGCGDGKSSWLRASVFLWCPHKVLKSQDDCGHTHNPCVDRNLYDLIFLWNHFISTLPLALNWGINLDLGVLTKPTSNQTQNNKQLVYPAHLSTISLCFLVLNIYSLPCRDYTCAMNIKPHLHKNMVPVLIKTWHGQWEIKKFYSCNKWI